MWKRDEIMGKEQKKEKLKQNEEALKAFNILRNIDYEFFRDLKNFTRGVLFAKGIIENE